MNKTTTIIIGLILVALSFYGGLKYGSTNNATATRSFATGQFAGRGGLGGRGGTNGGFVNGEILSKDATSLTVKLRDGGSSIVFLTSSTTVSKTSVGNVTDLTVGTQVNITGPKNQDGSVNAQMIQIRPAGQNFGM